MLDFDATALAQLDAPVRGIALLVEFEFLGGTIRSTTWPTDLVSGGFTWTRAGNALQVAALAESESLDTRRLEIRVSVSDSATLALALGNAAEFRGRTVRVMLQVVSETGTPAGAAVTRWVGSMEAIQIERTQPDANGERADTGGTIIISCGRKGVTRSRRVDGLRVTHAQQQHRYPGDTGYEYVASLIERPALWLSKRFQQI